MSETEKTAWQSAEFFKGFAPERLGQLQAIGTIVDYGPRETLFEEYDLAKDVFFVLSGEVSLAICTPKQACRQISVVREGELIGWSAVLGRARLFDTARTLTPVQTLVVDGGRLMELCKSDPEFGFEFMRRVAAVLADRLSATRMQLVELSGAHLPEFALESD